jgi:hypothetical protein
VKKHPDFDRQRECDNWMTTVEHRGVQVQELELFLQLRFELGALSFGLLSLFTPDLRLAAHCSLVAPFGAPTAKAVVRVGHHTP